MNLTKQPAPAGTLWSCPMHPDENGKSAGKCGECGMEVTPQDYVTAPVDREGLRAGDAKATVSLNNLPGKNEKTLEFTETLVPAKLAADEHDDHQEADQHEDRENADHRH